MSIQKRDEPKNRRFHKMTMEKMRQDEEEMIVSLMQEEQAKHETYIDYAASMFVDGNISQIGKGYLLSEDKRTQQILFSAFANGATDKAAFALVKAAGGAPTERVLRNEKNRATLDEIRAQGKGIMGARVGMAIMNHAENNPTIAKFLAKQPEEKGGLGMQEEYINRNVEINNDALSSVDTKELEKIREAIKEKEKQDD